MLKSMLFSGNSSGADGKSFVLTANISKPTSDYNFYFSKVHVYNDGVYILEYSTESQNSKRLYCLSKYSGNIKWVKSLTASSKETLDVYFMRGDNTRLMYIHDTRNFFFYDLRSDGDFIKYDVKYKSNKSLNLYDYYEDKNGNVFLLNISNNLYSFSSNKQYIWGKVKGSSISGFTPWRIYEGPGSSIYLLSYRPAVSNNGDMYFTSFDKITGNATNLFKVSSSNGRYFSSIFDFIVDKEGYIYVAFNVYNSGVITFAKFNSQGNILAKIGDITYDRYTSYIRSLFFDSDGNIIICGDFGTRPYIIKCSKNLEILSVRVIESINGEKIFSSLYFDVNKTSVYVTSHSEDGSLNICIKLNKEDIDTKDDVTIGPLRFYTPSVSIGSPSSVYTSPFSMDFTNKSLTNNTTININITSSTIPDNKVFYKGE